MEVFFLNKNREHFEKKHGQGLGSSGDVQTGRFVFFWLFEWEET